MKKFILLMLIFLTSIAVAYANLSTSNNNKQLAQQVKSFVNKAATYVKQHGKLNAVCAFHQKNGEFQKDEFYIFAFVCNDHHNNGFIVADPATPQYIFKNRSHTKVIKGMLKAIKKHPQGVWYKYQWIDPVNKKTVTKNSYIIMLPQETLCIGSGYYQD